MEDWIDFPLEKGKGGTRRTPFGETLQSSAVTRRDREVVWP
jgi:hypothetical protein